MGTKKSKKSTNKLVVMQIVAGWIMIVAGIVTAVFGTLLLSGIWWAAASCMFSSAYNFHLAENKKEEELKDE